MLSTSDNLLINRFLFVVGVDWAKAPNTPMRIKRIRPLVSFPDFSN